MKEIREQIMVICLTACLYAFSVILVLDKATSLFKANTVMITDIFGFGVFSFFFLFIAFKLIGMLKDLKKLLK